MENQKLLKNLRHRLSLLLCLMAFLAVGQGAWGKYYVYAGTSQSAGNRSYVGETDTESFVWERTFYTGENYYVTFTTTKSNIINDLKSNAIFCEKGSRTSEFSAAEKNECDGVNSLRFAMSKQSTNVTITLSNISGKGTGSSSTYSVSTGGSPTTTCTYSLKHAGWGNNDWGWKDLTDKGDGTYFVQAQYNGSGCNLSNDGGTSSEWYASIDVAQGITSGETCIFTVTPGSSGNCPTSGATIKVTKKTSATAPTVRIGDKPVETGDFDVNVSAYVAATGCADITKFTVYYSSSPITSTSASGVYSEEFSQSPAPELGSTTTLELLSSDIAEHDDWKSGRGDMYIRITGTNSAGESVLSDEIKLNYTTCQGIITSLQINPQGTQLAINTAQTFTYSVNAGATVNSVQWYKDGSPVATTTDYTFTPTTGDSFTIGLKAINNICNPDGFDAETQEYTVCVPIGDVTITNCPSGDVEIGEEITISATLSGTEPAVKWVWTVNGAEQEVTVVGLTSSITYTPKSATSYTVVAKATDCTGAEKTDVCNFVVKKAFTANNLNKTFSACVGGHQFNWADMFTPAPDSWSAVETTGGADATALFTLKNGVMTWNNEGRATGSYSYTFTAVKEGYKNATAVLTFSYTEATAPTGTISEILVTGDNPTYPWTKVTLQCEVTGSGITNVVWSSSNSGLVVSTGIDGTTATAYFKGKVVRKDTVYTITAEGQSESCGSTAPQTTTITVQPEEEEVCE